MDDEDPKYVEEHMYLMGDSQVLEQVDEWMKTQPISKAEPIQVKKAEAEKADAEIVKTLFDEIAAGKVLRNDRRLRDPQMTRRIYRELTR